ncbi:MULTISPECIES: hemerythrin domain-containing protein [Microbulbifer]|uniref:hemerythrin domain-containing protein n=1 Tax=Microbulbifer TaxID=48073 RepID=UPI001E35467C|nr:MULTISPECIES: hemerythrin domain-containing protein [Microbulbifer]UHQ56756.1 hemerythrin domain-containing protein [Microbulbifer sp. YPW16]
MHNLYRQLCRDHRNMQQLLDAFDQLLADFARQERDPGTLGLILDALDYISVYPDRWHHPVEDLAMERLRAKPGASLAPVETTLSEHRAITAATRHMSTLFYAIANDAAVERNQLFRSVREYLQLQRQHMERENREIFPQFEQLLTREDWQAIEQQLQCQRDPLFNAEIRNLYESLQHYLASLQFDACVGA